MQIALIGADPLDDEEVKLKKSLLVICSIPFIIAGAVWAAIYIFFGEAKAALIPLSYSVFSAASVIYFSITRRFSVFRFSQLLLILLLPFALMLALGGFVSGSSVILWGLISPMGALLFDKRSSAPRWLLAFVLLVVISGVLQPWAGRQTNLTNAETLFFFVINLAGVGGLIFLMVYYFVGRKYFYQARSETLLLNILPKEIVSALKEKHGIVADYFDGASILFADVVNFTPLSATLSPSQLVELLNEVFSAFDELVEKYQLEKIKTIGDCYMIAAGIPRAREDHALVLTKMALELRDVVNQRAFMGKKLQFRIGINSGPVVAGVIGRKKFSYDLWGDSVNIASRMESHGHSGTIQITEATYRLISERFDCSPQGKIQVKGKGEMNIWYVERERR